MPDLHLTLRDSDTGEATRQPPLSDDDAIELLYAAEITASRLVPWGSNFTFAVALECDEGGDGLAIYKPRAGERPLWDFPSGTLYQREHAAYLLARWLGWAIVPPTIVRDGPNGIGSLQLYVEPKPDRDDYDFWGQKLLPIEQIVVFDLISNNADRKLNHCLLDVHDRIWGIDHGLTFNVDPKLRTVLWHYCGDPITSSIRDDLTRMVESPGEVAALLQDGLSVDEVLALLRRTEALLEHEVHPPLDPGRNVPYGWW